MFNINAFQGTEFLFITELVAAVHSLMDTMYLFQKSTCSHELRNYNVFERYFYLRCIVFSKEHLQPYIWVVLLLFQEATCSDLVFLRLLSFFEISISIYKRAVEPTHVFKLTVFFQNRRSCSKEISNYDTSLVSGM